MEIFAIGLNYKTAPVDVREKFAVSDSQIRDVLEILSEVDQILELCLLSTCNRVEIYGVATQLDNLKIEVLKGLSKYFSMSIYSFEPYTFFYVGREAVKHIFRVSSSLDSMVIGEPQIVCQFKDSFSKAREYKAVKHILTRLLDKALNVSKKIRTSTGISKRAVSISYAAAMLAKKIFGELKDKNVLILGAGEMAELAAKNLSSIGVKHIFVSNRTFEKAVELAEKFGGSAIRFSKFLEFLPEVDIVIVSTGATEPIIKKEDIKTAMKSKKDHLFIIDISVPRNVEDAVNEVEGVYLYNIDDLKSIVNSNMEQRKIEAQRAELLLEQEVDKFMKWLEIQKITPVIASVRTYADSLREKQLQRLFKDMPYLTQKERENIDLAMRSLINKLLHRPTAFIKDKAVKEDNDLYIKIFQEMFNPRWDSRNKLSEDKEDVKKKD